MHSAKDIILNPIDSRTANAFIKVHHYSEKVVNNSQLHFGAFLKCNLHGVMQFGPPLDRRRMLGLVSGSNWYDVIELNRRAFDEVLPRNSESRCISIAIRLLRRHCPHVKWIVTFADGTQCGDGAIYRASGFLLVGIKKNNQIWESPDKQKWSRLSLTDYSSRSQQRKAMKICRVSRTKGQNILTTGASSMEAYKAAGFKPMPGFQLKYIYFLDKAARERLTVPVLPFSEIARYNAGMYLGKKISRANSVTSTPDFSSQEVTSRDDLSAPSSPLQSFQSYNDT